MVAFATNPKLEYTISGSPSWISSVGTMERFMAEVAAGLHLVGERTEFTLFWDGAVRRSHRKQRHNC